MQYNYWELIYLIDRRQYTKIGKFKYSQQTFDCGVLQGSSLGPLLFILYVNDLPKTSQFPSTLFADDTYLSLADKNSSDLEHKTNSQLQLIDTWLKNNKLSLYCTKTTYLLFNKHPHLPVNSKFTLSINNIEITKSDSVKYIGLLIHDKLNWSAHAQELFLQLAGVVNAVSSLWLYSKSYTNDVVL